MRLSTVCAGPIEFVPGIRMIGTGTGTGQMAYRFVKYYLRVGEGDFKCLLPVQDIFLIPFCDARIDGWRAAKTTRISGLCVFCIDLTLEASKSGGIRQDTDLVK